jgi:hypothetical protein
MWQEMSAADSKVIGPNVPKVAPKSCLSKTAHENQLLRSSDLSGRIRDAPNGNQVHPVLHIFLWRIRLRPSFTEATLLATYMKGELGAFAANG